MFGVCGRSRRRDYDGRRNHYRGRRCDYYRGSVRNGWGRRCGRGGLAAFRAARVSGLRESDGYAAEQYRDSKRQRCSFQ
jgi:hypothetical protein